jgi:hypothetical protein
MDIQIESFYCNECLDKKRQEVIGINLWSADFSLCEKHCKELIKKLNAFIRERHHTD